MSLDTSQLGQVFEKAGLSNFFPPPALDSLIRYTTRMLQINETLNLTRWTEDSQVLHFHFLDSAWVLPTLQGLQSPPAARWLDLGTGCGFPGVVLAAAFPSWEVTLLDSVAKKAKGVAECLQEAGLQAPTLGLRSEELGRNPSTRETWDGVVSRAVADFPVALEYAIPLLKIGGYFVNWMTQDQLQSVDKSAAALQELQGKIVQTVEYSLPEGNQKRGFVVVEKIGKTPELFPRRAGRASKFPL